MDTNTKIGWIGSGVMGTSMYKHLLNAGFRGSVFSRTKSKAQPLLDSGAQWADSPMEVAGNSDIVFSIVGYPADVQEVYFGDKGLFKDALKGSILVDMTTTSPSIAKEIYNTAKLKGIYTLDAPVSGGDVGARNATLSIMAGGDREVFDRVLPLFNILGKNIQYHGPAGSGQHTKMCNQIMVAATMIGACESILYGYKAGLDLEVMLQSISKGAAACWTLDNLAPRMLKHDFEPGFFVEHFVKDMGIVLDEAKKMNLVLPGLSLVHQFYIAVNSMGYQKKGTQALLLALAKLSNISYK
ncbi:MAG: NAD(P)-dependent oxidoreductase [Bacteroidales bacterium]|nr:NAD(P)-dependent oxidoreductase [Bacteroidales bacterium]